MIVSPLKWHSSEKEQSDQKGLQSGSINAWVVHKQAKPYWWTIRLKSSVFGE